MWVVIEQQYSKYYQSVCIKSGRTHYTCVYLSCFVIYDTLIFPWSHIQQECVYGFTWLWTNHLSPFCSLEANLACVFLLFLFILFFLWLLTLAITTITITGGEVSKYGKVRCRMAGVRERACCELRPASIIHLSVALYKQDLWQRGRHTKTHTHGAREELWKIQRERCVRVEKDRLDLTFDDKHLGMMYCRLGAVHVFISVFNIQCGI